MLRKIYPCHPRKTINKSNKVFHSTNGNHRTCPPAHRRRPPPSPLPSVSLDAPCCHRRRRRRRCPSIRIWVGWCLPAQEGLDLCQDSGSSGCVLWYDPKKPGGMNPIRILFHAKRTSIFILKIYCLLAKENLCINACLESYRLLKSVMLVLMCPVVLNGCDSGSFPWWSSFCWLPLFSSRYKHH